MQKITPDHNNNSPSEQHNIVLRARSGLRLRHIMRRSWRTKLGVLLVIAAIISGLMTYGALAELPPFGDDPDVVLWLLNCDLILLLMLVLLIAQRIVMVWSGRRRGVAGSHLHVRLVSLFSVLVAVPTIVMTVFSAMFFHFGVQAWFSQRVQTAINESQAVATAYLEEHKRVIRADMLAMGNDLDRQGEVFLLDDSVSTKIMDTQSFLRNLSEAIVIDRKGRVRARSSLTFSLEYDTLPDYVLESADVGDVVLMMSDNQDRVRALVKLRNISDAYLLVGRLIDPQVLGHLMATEVAVSEYSSLQSHYAGIKITVTMIFIMVGLLLLMAAIWMGLILARELVSPISELVSAAERVRSGDLKTRIADKKRIKEFTYLANSFNRMTDQLQTQRDDLVEANRQVDARRHLIETVLGGVSSGVIGVDQDGVINLANTAAESLLQRDNGLSEYYLLDIIPEIEGLLDDIRKTAKKDVQGEVVIHVNGKERRTFLFRIAVEKLDRMQAGLIITFDDITALQSAQRQAAWSDVARRIAHEIKNPLTPIQLSAERLKRKYLDEIQTDKETFLQCVETITKHVQDIGRMVNEFSSFARMPVSVLKNGDLLKCLNESLLLFKQAHTDITFECNRDEQDDAYIATFDAQQFRQVMSNLLKNAAEAVALDTEEKRVSLFIYQDSAYVYVAISDSGAGFPDDVDHVTLTEPYVTYKQKGTGLGLAIVKKIMEDHGGRVMFGVPHWLSSHTTWKPLCGGCVSVYFPKEIDDEKRGRKV